MLDDGFDGWWTSHVNPSTAENWLQAFVFAWNQLI
jgi:hypothetical protein